jgi:hypothetical protein
MKSYVLQVEQKDLLQGLNHSCDRRWSV